MATILAIFYYSIPKNQFEKEVYRLLIEANRTGNKLYPDPTISILAKRYRDVLKTAIRELDQTPIATRLIVVRTRNCVALMRKSLKTGKTKCFCDVTLHVLKTV